ncbi:hypothetical protein [Neoroseomonas soli]|uniref:Uncharacterized protein n=1 Tax=Neoroseomonas soli TaxID=1081025 RepID=A0A9X9X2X9_9PROT|nr:hypothetical protein [Neoroseomonas soli]MBR0673758.1 hypothetical protein [Neoroseomonas soli]
MTPTIRAACAAVLFAVPLAACDDGPAERIGERVDRAAEEVRDAIDPPNGPAERIGRALDRATE